MGGHRRDAEGLLWGTSCLEAKMGFHVRECSELVSVARKKGVLAVSFLKTHLTFIKETPIASLELGPGTPISVKQRTISVNTLLPCTFRVSSEKVAKLWVEEFNHIMEEVSSPGENSYFRDFFFVYYIYFSFGRRNELF